MKRDYNKIRNRPLRSIKELMLRAETLMEHDEDDFELGYCLGQIKAIESIIKSFETKTINELLVDLLG